MQLKVLQLFKIMVGYTYDIWPGGIGYAEDCKSLYVGSIRSRPPIIVPIYST